MPSSVRLASSFRDPSGHVFKQDGVLLRRVNASYLPEFDRLHTSGLYDHLVERRLMVSHEIFGRDTESTTIRPEFIPFISHPYEWSFSQLKDAALHTLKVHKAALERGMALKDASAYNIQFLNGKPIFIDTLSFEVYEEGSPWVAYRQFCQHFLNPLALMALVDIRLGKLLREFIDGIPADLTSKLLPGGTKFKPAFAMHIHMMAKAQRNASTSSEPSKRQSVSKTGLLAILDSLEGAVKGLNWMPEGTVWGDYYSDTNYTDESMKEKHRLVAEFLRAVEPTPGTVWDLGANTGEFSRIAADMGCHAIAWDMDEAAVEKAYRRARDKEERNVLPLLLDLTNPSPAIGWALAERESLVQRGPADCVMALALVHHLAIGNNVPLPQVAEFFAQVGKWLIVEFVPKQDSQTQRLLSTREDVFDGYTLEGFTESFAGVFEIVRQEPIKGTYRTLFLMRAR